MKPVSPLILCALFLLCSLPAGASDAPEEPAASPEDTRQMSEQVKEIGQEMTRVFIQKLQEFLDAELQRLRQASPKTTAELKQQLEAVESQLKKHPQDALSHRELGEIYDRLGDGANAIIHMRRAEDLEQKQGSLKGLAESRRNLRHYYLKYGFKPEDFDLGG